MINYDLKDKNALVTGVSRKKGLGAAICNALASQGVNVFTTYYTSYDNSMPWGIQQNEQNEILEDLKKMGVKAAGVEVNLLDEDSSTKIFDFANNSLGHIDILINNAAASRNSNVININSDLLNEAYSVNLKSVILLSSEFLKRFQKSVGGRIINITSGQREHPMPEEIPYIVTKAGIDVFTKSACFSLAKKGITINAIDPGPTDTGWMTNEIYETIKLNHPLERISVPEDITPLILFLLSDDSSKITGQIIKASCNI